MFARKVALGARSAFRNQTFKQLDSKVKDIFPSKPVIDSNDQRVTIDDPFANG
jgi:hypothetical protein